MSCQSKYQNQKPEQQQGQEQAQQQAEQAESATILAAEHLSITVQHIATVVRWQKLGAYHVCKINALAKPENVSITMTNPI